MVSLHDNTVASTPPPPPSPGYSNVFKPSHAEFTEHNEMYTFLYCQYICDLFTRCNTVYLGLYRCPQYQNVSTDLSLSSAPTHAPHMNTFMFTNISGREINQLAFRLEDLFPWQPSFLNSNDSLSNNQCFILLLVVINVKDFPLIFPNM